jgi:hypothetical protein
MGDIHHKNAVSQPRSYFLAAILFHLVALNQGFAQPMLGFPKSGADPTHAQITLGNCNGTNVQYVVQMSTNLTDWIPAATNQPAPTNLATVPSTSSLCFYRIKVVSLSFPALAIICKSNFDISGNNCIVGGSGKNAQDTSGAIAVGSISSKGHWNFHYDEHMAQH